MLIYPDACGDYYSKIWSAHTYEEQFNTVLNNSDYLAVSNHEFYAVSIFGKIYQAIKSIFGFHDYTQDAKVNSELLKFLYYGEANHLITEKMVTVLKKDHDGMQSKLTNSTVRNLVNEIMARHLTQNGMQKDQHLSKMRAVLIEYHHTNASQLKPNYWSRSSIKPILNQQLLIEFGDSALQMAKKTFTEKEPNIFSALDQFLFVHGMRNPTPEFQQKFWLQFQYFLDLNKNHAAITLKALSIQEAYLGMASTALEKGNLVFAKQLTNYLLTLYPHDPLLKVKIGNFFLQFKSYTEAEPYFNLLVESDPKNPVLMEQIGDAYWKLENLPKAYELWKNTIEIYKSIKKPIYSDEYYNNKQKLANLYEWMGKMYSKDKAFQNAISNFKDALKTIKKIEFSQGFDKQIIDRYSYLLGEAYLQQWKSSPHTFDIHWKDCFHLLGNIEKSKSDKTNIIMTHKPLVQELLLTSLKTALTSNNAKQVSECLYWGSYKWFSDDSEFIYQVLSILIEQKAEKQIKGYFPEWNKSFCTAEFKEKICAGFQLIGDVEAAKKAYTETIGLYEYEKSKANSAKESQVLESKLNTFKSNFSQFSGLTLTREEVKSLISTTTLDMFKKQLNAVDDKFK